MEDRYLFRGMRVDTKEWVEGDLIQSKLPNSINWIKPISILGLGAICTMTDSFYEVIPKTVGQLRYTRGDKKYFDGDVYYQAGYGKEIVSELCELQCALLDGNEGDIEGVIGNIHEGADDDE